MVGALNIEEDFQFIHVEKATHAVICGSSCTISFLNVEINRYDLVQSI